MKIKLLLGLFLISAITSLLVGLFPLTARAAGDVDKRAIDILIACRDPKNGGTDKCDTLTTCIESVANGGAASGVCGAILRIDEIFSRQSIKKAIDSCEKVGSNTTAACTKTLTTCTAGSVGSANLTKKTADECLKKVTTGKLADAVVKPPAGATDPAGDSADEENNCTIKGIGWLVCPVVIFGAQLVDGSYEVVDKLLAVQPLLTTGSDRGIFGAWSAMRSFANVAFVIAFMVIIVSQLTSVGVSNYGLKKLLPKVVIAVILVNVSYWVCAILVDASNIIGGSLKGLIDGIDVGTTANKPTAFNVADGNIWTGLLAGVIGTGVVAATAVYGVFSIVLPLLIAAALAIFTVVIVLTLRQALIILLIAVAPLAFVAFLLPNTEGLFKKWWSLFKILLLMYPIIALIFGVSAIASKVIMASSDEIIIQAMGAGIAIIPLFITPIVMKTAGGFLNRVGGFVNNPNRGPADKARKGAKVLDKDYKGVLKNRGLSGKFTGYGFATRRNADMKNARGNREREVGRAETKYNAESATSDDQRILGVVGANKINEKLGTNLGTTQAQRMAVGSESGAEQRAAANAESQLDKINAENVGATLSLIKNSGQSQQQIANLALGGAAGVGSGGVMSKFDASGDSVLQQAAIEHVVATNNQQGYERLLNSSSGWDKSGSEDDKKRGREMQQTFADAMQSSNQRPAYVGQMAIENIRKGEGADQKTLINGALENNAISSSGAATGDKDTLETMLKEINKGNISEKGMENFFNANRTALDDPRLNTQISKNRDVVEKIAPKVTASIDAASLKSMSEADMRTDINSSGGMSKLSDGDINRIITATKGNTSSAALHSDMLAERTRRL